MSKLIKFTATAALVAAIMSAPLSAKSLAEQDRDVASFNRVELMSSANVYIKVGGKQSVRVVADDHIINKVTTEVDGSTLEVSMERGRYNNIKKMEIHITVPSLEGASLQGSGDIDVEDAKGDMFDAALSGSGDINLKSGEFDSLKVSLRGSGDVTVDGKCGDISIKLRGSGDVDANEMKCESASVTIQGSGDVDVHADKDVSANIMGSGDITVYGKPDKLNSRVHGSGDVHVRK